MTASETRYINQVLRPALSDLQTARVQAKASLKGALGEQAVLIKSNLHEMDNMETKIKSHMKKTLGLAAKL